MYSPDNLKCKISLIVVLLLALIKTMFFLRIFNSFSYMVLLLRSVIYDLKTFMLFYAILMYIFALILGVLGINNFSREEDMHIIEDSPTSYPGIEYKHLRS